jgi:hypothetical protein
MKALSTLSALLVLALAPQATTLAQPPAGAAPAGTLNARSMSALRPYYPHYAFNPDYYRFRAATAAESYARGLAAMTYARGQYNLLTAGARGLHAEAHSREIANHEQGVQAYYRLRQYNREAVALERGPRATQADLVRLASQDKPTRLSPTELSNAGEISWPVLLQAEEFKVFRAELEKAFAQRAAKGALGLSDHVKVSETTKVMLQVLQSYVGGVEPMDYISARRFIESLALEARKPLG